MVGFFYGVNYDGGMNDKPDQNEIEMLYEGKFVNMVRRGRWEYASRTKVEGIVGIVGLTEAGELVLVEQYRAPVGVNVIELPAGLVGDTDEFAGEGLQGGAERELLEETGYAGEDWALLCAGVPSAGICDEVITLFGARGLKKVGEGGGDGSESIVCHLVPIEELEGWLTGQQEAGKMIDLKIYAGLFCLREKL